VQITGIALAVSRGRWPRAVLLLGTALLSAEAISIGMQDLEGRFFTTQEWLLVALVAAAMAVVLSGQALPVARSARGVLPAHPRRRDARPLLTALPS